MTAILGIESSCDETAASVVVDGHDVRSNVVASQVELHRKYGGVVPEIASRAHIECFDVVTGEALEQAGCAPADIDAIAVTNKPGLVGSLLIGVTAAKTLSWAWNKPLITVDHIQAHAYSAAIGVQPAPFPAVALIVSGGHTSLYEVTGPGETKPLGATLDDAAGEAFDKVATMLDLAYPGGPEIEKTARAGDATAIAFPKTLLRPGSLDFSFSGVKTAVLYCIHGKGKTTGGLASLTTQRHADIAASFQRAVVDVLVTKTMRAVARTGVEIVLLGGGVAANGCLRQALDAKCERKGLRFLAAEMSYCADNAAMIAALGYHQMQRGDLADLCAEVRSAI